MLCCAVLFYAAVSFHMGLRLQVQSLIFVFFVVTALRTTFIRRTLRDPFPFTDCLYIRPDISEFLAVPFSLHMNSSSFFKAFSTFYSKFRHLRSQNQLDITFKTHLTSPSPYPSTIPDSSSSPQPSRVL